MSMLFGLTVFVLLVMQAFGATLAAPSRSIAGPVDVISPGVPVPKFDHGLTASFGPACHYAPCTVGLFSPSTGKRFAVNLWNDTAGTVAVYDFAVSSNNMIAFATRRVAGLAVPEIRLFDASGNSIGSIATGSYIATKIAFDAAGDLWALGGKDSKGEDASDDYNVLRKYSAPGGSLLASYLPRSSFHTPHEPGINTGATGDSQLSVTKTGVALYNAPTEEWIEVASDGTIVRRELIAEASSQLAPRRIVVTASGKIVIAKNGRGTLYSFDSGSAGYSKIPSSAAGILVGVDGDHLVFARMTSNGGGGLFEWRHVE